ncbi:hypothetical protein PRZ48_005526 [Zasmidium cellare]|uniref:AB hydrolase-1 domain-containing protein n=1 Tax=Zasmidium cellare TaxID=395010 RepID=A0ABR0EMR4_ZASCE|nr:hypothetical protein PRZ48_005526 [Zasmidium cellare]
MELTSTFAWNGWNIKYGVFEPEGTNSQNLKTLLFVHGTPWSSEVFTPLSKALLSTKQFRLILYDLPGYGQSQEAPQYDNEGDALELFKLDLQKDTSVKAQGAALAALINHLDLSSPPSIIAHDIAGAIVLRTHLIHNIDFTSLMLLETNTVLPWGDGFYKLARSRPEAFVEMPPAIFESVVRAVIRSASHNPKTFPSRWEDALAKPWTQDAEPWRQRSFMRQIAQANDEDVKEMLDQDMYSQVRCDVKIVWGESDQWIPKAKLEKLGQMLGDRMQEFVVVAEAGHLVMVDQPERIAVEVLGWVGRY